MIYNIVIFAIIISIIYCLYRQIETFDNRKLLDEYKEIINNKSKLPWSLNRERLLAIERELGRVPSENELQQKNIIHSEGVEHFYQYGDELQQLDPVHQDIRTLMSNINNIKQKLIDSDKLLLNALDTNETNDISFDEVKKPISVILNDIQDNSNAIIDDVISLTDSNKNSKIEKSEMEDNIDRIDSSINLIAENSKAELVQKIVSEIDVSSKKLRTVIKNSARSIFKKIDLDNSGDITKKELNTVIEKLTTDINYGLKEAYIMSLNIKNTSDKSVSQKDLFKLTSTLRNIVYKYNELEKILFILMGMVINEHNLVNGKIKVDNKSKVTVNNSKNLNNNSSNIKRDDSVNYNADSVTKSSSYKAVNGITNNTSTTTNVRSSTAGNANVAPREAANTIVNANANADSDANKSKTKDPRVKNLMEQRKNWDTLMNNSSSNEPVGSDDKYYSNSNNRDANLLSSNNGKGPLNPASFNFTPNVEFNHKQPSKQIASAYGWSYMPPQYWSVPQKRPPACIPSKKNTATVTPIYDKSAPVDVLDWTQVGSILPKYEYTEVHNPDYYYPGWIAQDEKQYPGKNGKSVMKSGEYYNLNRATPTQNDSQKHNSIHTTGNIKQPNKQPVKQEINKIVQNLKKNKNGIVEGFQNGGQCNLLWKTDQSSAVQCDGNIGKNIGEHVPLSSRNVMHRTPLSSKMPWSSRWYNIEQDMQSPNLNEDVNASETSMQSQDEQETPAPPAPPTSTPPVPPTSTLPVPPTSTPPVPQDVNPSKVNETKLKPEYKYTTTDQALNACKADGYKRLCTKEEVINNNSFLNRCKMAWTSDEGRGWNMSEIRPGCNAGTEKKSGWQKGWGNGQTAPAGAYCCEKINDNTNSFKVTAGRRKLNDTLDDCVSGEKKYNVRCCADKKPKTGYWKKNPNCSIWGSSFINKKCNSNKTYAEASDICKTQGARLCTETELKNNCTAGTGCNYDNYALWTKDVCNK